MTMAVGDLVFGVWHIAAIGLAVVLSVLATGHAVLNKRDSRAARTGLAIGGVIA